MTRLLWSLPLLAVALVACAPAGPAAPPVGHPAEATAPTSATTLPLDPLAAAPAPTLPDALRPGDAPPAAAGTMDPAHAGHTGTAHDAPNHGGMSDAPMGEALGAYLALHDALASDDADGARAHGRHTAHAVAAWLDAPPDDDPHLWHRRADDASALREAADDLGTATDLAAIRRAFGHLSVPFARVVEAAGTPDGLTLERHRCGMAPDVPEQGIWLQRPGPVRNPYFGAAMLTCGTRTGTVGATAAPDDGHAGH